MNGFSDILDLIHRGGVVMYPLLLCSITSLTLIIERVIVLKGASTDTSGLMKTLGDRLEKGDLKGAAAACDSVPGPVSRMLAGGLKRVDAGEAAVERQMEEQALAESPGLHRRLSWLDTIITVSPLLGLLGTIIGMIGSFRILGTSGVSHPSAITSGVAEALIATATGLVIAIVTLIGYNGLNNWADDILNTMELRATQLLNLLAGLRERRDARDSDRALEPIP